MNSVRARSNPLVQTTRRRADVMAIDWGSPPGQAIAVRRAALERNGNLTLTMTHDGAVNEKVFKHALTANGTNL